MPTWILFLVAFFALYVRIGLKAALQLSVVDYKFLRIIPLSYISQYAELFIIGADAWIILRKNPLEILILGLVTGSGAWLGTHTSMHIHRWLNSRLEGD